jgi:hemerythrin-like domain-containing protein
MTMDAFELLKADHRKVSKLFDQLESVEGNQKLDVFAQIKSELDLHAHIEETILYPALEKPEDTHEMTLEAYEEHKVVKTLLAELAPATSASDEWQAKAKVLRDNVDHHVEEEESELFEKAEDAFSDEEIEARGARMEAEKANPGGRPVPGKSAAKKSGSTARKSAAKEPGILTKLANLVGLAGNPEEKRAAKRASAKQVGAKKSSKKTAKKATKKSTKSSKASASKRASPGQGRKRAASRTIGSRKPSAVRTGGAGKKGSKKKASKK